MRLFKLTSILILSISFSSSAQQFVKVEQVELQPLTARVKRLKALDQCWAQNAPRISAKERPESETAYEHARQVYRRIIAESNLP